MGAAVAKNYSYDDLHLKDLRVLGKELRISGWHKMAKADLVPLLGQLDPTGKCVKSKGIPAPSAANSSAKPAKRGGSSDPSKAPSAKNPAKSAPTKEIPAEEGSAKSAPTKSKKSAKARAAAKAAVVKPAPHSKESADTKGGKAKKTNPKPASKSVPVSKPESLAVSADPASRTTVVRSKLRMTAPPPLSFSDRQKANQKGRRRRAPAPKREDVTLISMSEEPSLSPAENMVDGVPRPESLKDKMLRRKTLETPSSGVGAHDRIVLQVCGPFWLHAWWEISGNLITRVRAAMGHLWHTADPVLRLYRVRQNGAGVRHTEFIGDAVIHGGVYNWFLNVDDPPGSFLVEIGYRSRDRQFFSLVSSNTVETPQNYIQESMGWSESGWNMLTASTMVSPFEGESPESDENSLPPAPRASTRSRRVEFDLAVDAEVVIKGQTSPDAQLTVRGERIWVREDGSFLIRYHLPERRHVFPVAAVSRDGIDSKTIILSVERNTKNLETVVRSQMDED